MKQRHRKRQQSSIVCVCVALHCCLARVGMRRLAALRLARVRAQVPRVVCLIRFYFKRVPATSGPTGTGSGSGCGSGLGVLRFIRNNTALAQHNFKGQAKHAEHSFYIIYEFPRKSRRPEKSKPVKHTRCAQQRYMCDGIIDVASRAVQVTHMVYKVFLSLDLWPILCRNIGNTLQQRHKPCAVCRRTTH